MSNVFQQGGYVVLSSVSGASSSSSYAVLSPAASVSSALSYAIIAHPASVSGSTSYAITSNLAAATASPTYVVLSVLYPPNEEVEIVHPFVEERFPECVSFGSSGGPGFKTSVFEFDSGLTARVAEWDQMRAKYEAAFDNVSPEDIADVEEFFYSMRGRALGFRYKDWNDYQISAQNVGVGDGTSTEFQTFKRYQSGGHTFDRIIKKTVKGTASITVDGVAVTEGVEYYMLDSSGHIVFVTPPDKGSIIKISYIEFDVPVRFDTDYINVSYNDFRQHEVSIPLIEVLV